MKERNKLSSSLSSSGHEPESSLAERLRQLQGAQSVNAFAIKCEITESLMRKYLSGSIPGADKLVQIARLNGVSIEWLATGEGPMKKAETAPAAAVAKINADLLRACIGAVNRYLKEKGLEPPDEVRAGLTAALYRYADAKGVADQQDMKEFLKLVA